MPPPLCSPVSMAHLPVRLTPGTSSDRIDGWVADYKTAVPELMKALG